MILVGTLAFFTHIATAQRVVEGPGLNKDTTPNANKSVSTDAKLSKLENEMQSLKRDNETLKKQVGQLKSPSINVPRKVSVSRVGSKQVVIE